MISIMDYFVANTKTGLLAIILLFDASFTEIPILQEVAFFVGCLALVYCTYVASYFSVAGPGEFVRGDVWEAKVPYCMVR